MTPDQLKVLTGVIVGVGFIALCHQMYWQVRIGLSDRQTWSAFFFLLMTTIVIGQLVLAYLSVAPFGTTNRGPVFFFLWVGSLIWWSLCTARHNAAILRKIKDAEKFRKPLQ